MENMVKMKSSLFEAYFGKKVFLPATQGLRGMVARHSNQLGAIVKGYANP